MEQRTRHKLRRLIELNVQAVERGLMPLPKAAATMDSVGAPFEVVCRVLMPFKHGTPVRVDADRKAQPVENHWSDIAAR